MEENHHDLNVPAENQDHPEPGPEPVQEQPRPNEQEAKKQPTPEQGPQTDFQPPLPESLSSLRQKPNDPKQPTKLPRGLEPLATARQLVVKHDSDMIETKCKCYKNCQYEVYNERHQLVYYACEDISLFSLCCMCKFRPYRMRIYDLLQYNCLLFRGNINLLFQHTTVELPVGKTYATIKKVSGENGKIAFHVFDSSSKLVMKIISANAVGSDKSTVKFDVFGADDDKAKIGDMSKTWAGFFREAFTDAESFGINLPVDMDVSWKAVLLGALFLIDYTCYEGKTAKAQ